jgi:hypothetical protein
MNNIIPILIILVIAFFVLRRIPLVILIPIGILVLSFMFPQDKGLQIANHWILSNVWLFLLLGFGAFLLRRIFRSR